jgi:hypothetical protein
MSRLTIRLPDTKHQQLKAFACARGVSSAALWSGQGRGAKADQGIR